MSAAIAIVHGETSPCWDMMRMALSHGLEPVDMRLMSDFLTANDV